MGRKKAKRGTLCGKITTIVWKQQLAKIIGRRNDIKIAQTEKMNCVQVV